MPDKSTVVASAELAEATVLDAHKALGEESQETVQTVVWLVGLASAMLVVLGAKDHSFVTDTGQRAFFSLLLFVTISAGVLQRVLQQLRRQSEVVYMMALRTAVASFKYEADVPSALDNNWPKARIAANIKHFFGFDYAYLAEPDTTLEEAQAVYASLFASFSAFDDRRMKEFGRMMAAIKGVQASAGTTEVAESPPDYTAIRDAERRMKWWGWGSRAAFRVTAGFFLMSVIALMAAMSSEPLPCKPQLAPAAATKLSAP